MTDNSVYSVCTEIYGRTYRIAETVHPPLGRDGDAVGNQPDGGADPRAAVPVAAGAAGRGDCGDAERGAIEREHVDPGVGDVGDRSGGACAGRPARTLRVDERRVGDVPAGD